MGGGKWRMLENVAEVIYSPEARVRGAGGSGRTEGQELEVLTELQSSGGVEMEGGGGGKEGRRASVHDSRQEHGRKVMWGSGQSSEGSREEEESHGRWTGQ